MKILDLILEAVAAVAASDFAANTAPAALDVGGLPVRKYLGAGAGVYGAGHLLGGKPSMTRAAVMGVAAVLASDFAVSQLASNATLGIDATTLPYLRYAGAAAGIFGADKFGVTGAVAKAV